MRRHLFLGTVLLFGMSGYAPDLFAEDQAALTAFATVQKVFQSPRCQNCHIPGDSPLQFDAAGFEIWSRWRVVQGCGHLVGDPQQLAVASES